MTKLLAGLDENATSTMNDMLLAKQIAETLMAHYPHPHLWAVTCEGHTGIATIKNLNLSGTWGYVLKLPKLYSASSLTKDVIRAGGEILERFHMDRGQFNEAQYAALKTNHAGDFLFEK